MLIKLNTRINNLRTVLFTHGAELTACNGPVPRDVVDKLVHAASEVVDVTDASPLVLHVPTAGDMDALTDLQRWLTTVNRALDAARDRDGADQ